MEASREMSSELRECASAGDWKACAAWIRRGAPVDDTDECGVTALGYAAAKGHVRACAVLVDAKADPFVCDPQGRTALHRAVVFGAGSDTCAILLREPKLLNAVDNAGRSALDLAILHDRILLVALFVNLGCNGVEGALYEAAAQGRVDLTRAILSNAKSHDMQRHTEKAFDIARTKGHAEVCDLLRPPLFSSSCALQ
jgi:uncharacterized protein